MQDRHSRSFSVCIVPGISSADYILKGQCHEIVVEIRLQSTIDRPELRFANQIRHFKAADRAANVRGSFLLRSAANLWYRIIRGLSYREIVDMMVSVHGRWYGEFRQFAVKWCPTCHSGKHIYCLRSYAAEIYDPKAPIPVGDSDLCQHVSVPFVIDSNPLKG
jgi:hypothetical protein